MVDKLDYTMMGNLVAGIQDQTADIIVGDNVSLLPLTRDTFNWSYGKRVGLTTRYGIWPIAGHASNESSVTVTSPDSYMQGYSFYGLMGSEQNQPAHTTAAVDVYQKRRFVLGACTLQLPTVNPTDGNVFSDKFKPILYWFNIRDIGGSAFQFDLCPSINNQSNLGVGFRNIYLDSNVQAPIGEGTAILSYGGGGTDEARTLRAIDRLHTVSLKKLRTLSTAPKFFRYSILQTSIDTNIIEFIGRRNLPANDWVTSPDTGVTTSVVGAPYWFSVIVQQRKPFSISAALTVSTGTIPKQATRIGYISEDSTIDVATQAVESHIPIQGITFFNGSAEILYPATGWTITGATFINPTPYNYYKVSDQPLQVPLTLVGIVLNNKPIIVSFNPYLKDQTFYETSTPANPPVCGNDFAQWIDPTNNFFVPRLISSTLLTGTGSYTETWGTTQEEVKQTCWKRAPKFIHGTNTDNVIINNTGGLKAKTVYEYAFSIYNALTGKESNVGTPAKVFCDNDNSAILIHNGYNPTLFSGSAIANPITFGRIAISKGLNAVVIKTTNLTDTITVNVIGHGFESGALIEVTAATPPAGSSIAASAITGFRIVKNIDADHFSFSASATETNVIATTGTMNASYGVTIPYSATATTVPGSNIVTLTFSEPHYLQVGAAFTASSSGTSFGGISAVNLSINPAKVVQVVDANTFTYAAGANASAITQKYSQFTVPADYDPGTEGIAGEGTPINYLSYRVYYREIGSFEWLFAGDHSFAKIHFKPFCEDIYIGSDSAVGLPGGQVGGYTDNSDLPSDNYIDVCSFQDRMFWLTKGMVRYSSSENAFVYPVRNYVSSPSGEFRGMIAHYFAGQARQDGRLVLFGSDGTYDLRRTDTFAYQSVRVSASAPPVSVPLEGSDIICSIRGSDTAFSGRCACVAEGFLYFWGPTGIFRDDGVNLPVRISQGIEPLIFESYDKEKVAESFAYYNKRTREILFFYRPTAAITAQTGFETQAFVYSIRIEQALGTVGAWTQYGYNQIIDWAQDIDLTGFETPTKIGGARTIIGSRTSTAATVSRAYFHDDECEGGDFYPGGEMMVKQISFPDVSTLRFTLATGYSAAVLAGIAFNTLIAVKGSSSYGGLSSTNNVDGFYKVKAKGAGTIDIQVVGTLGTVPPTVFAADSQFPIFVDGFHNINCNLDTNFLAPNGIESWHGFRYLQMLLLPVTVPTGNETPTSTVAWQCNHTLNAAPSQKTFPITPINSRERSTQIIMDLYSQEMSAEGQGIEFTINYKQLFARWTLYALTLFYKKLGLSNLKHYQRPNA